jgi:hypothetical protein
MDSLRRQSAEDQDGKERAGVFPFEDFIEGMHSIPKASRLLKYEMQAASTIHHRRSRGSRMFPKCNDHPGEIV